MAIRPPTFDHIGGVHPPRPFVKFYGPQATRLRISHLGGNFELNSITVIMGKTRRYKVAMIAPTCFYYQAPLFRAIAGADGIDLTVYFCSDEGVSGKDVKIAYGSNNTWGVQDELLHGYRSIFLRNHAPWGSYLKSLVGLANFGIWKELKEGRPDVVIIMSWMNPTWWLTFLACLKFEIPTMFLTDANISAERLSSTWKSWIKRRILGNFIFPLAAGFLCAGRANQQLYTYFGVPEEKLVEFAYSWGYDRFVDEAKRTEFQKAELRRKFGLPQDAVVILYCGRFSTEKGSIELLEAYRLVSHPKKALVLVGDGRLRKWMEDYADRNGLESIYFMGFQTRNDMAEFYAMADCLVLPSLKETWGMVINEALCFSLPVVVSDQVGAGFDLVVPEGNGHIFPAGDVLALADRIHKLIELPDEERHKMGEMSRSIITKWLDRDLAKILYEYIDSLYQAQN